MHESRRGIARDARRDASKSARNAKKHVFLDLLASRWELNLGSTKNEKFIVRLGILSRLVPIAHDRTDWANRGVCLKFRAFFRFEEMAGRNWLNFGYLLRLNEKLRMALKTFWFFNFIDFLEVKRVLTYHGLVGWSNFFYLAQKDAQFEMVQGIVYLKTFYSLVFL